MIEIKQVSKHRAKGLKPVLDGVSFKVRNRKICGILGPKGAGKSALLDIIAGVSDPTEGTVLINGYDIVKQPIEAKKQTGYLASPAALFPDMTPFEYLHFVAEARGVKGELREAQVKEALALTGLLSVQDRRICSISAGLKQRVGLAAALLGNPDVILLDESTEGMLASQINETRELIRRLAQTKTVILGGHILSDMLELCDQIVILSEGRVTADGTPEELVASEPSLAAEFAAMTRRADEVPTVEYDDDAVEGEKEVTETEEADLHNGDADEVIESNGEEA